MSWRRKKTVTSQKGCCKDEFNWVQMEELEGCIDHIVFTKLQKIWNYQSFNTRTVTQSKLFTEVKSMLDEH